MQLPQIITITCLPGAPIARTPAAAGTACPVCWCCCGLEAEREGRVRAHAGVSTAARWWRRHGATACDPRPSQPPAPLTTPHWLPPPALHGLHLRGGRMTCAGCPLSQSSHSSPPRHCSSQPRAPSEAPRQLTAAPGGSRRSQFTAMPSSYGHSDRGINLANYRLLAQAQAKKSEGRGYRSTFEWAQEVCSCLALAFRERLERTDEHIYCHAKSFLR